MRRLSVIIILLSCAVFCIAQDKMHTKNNKAGIYDNIYELYLQVSKHRSDSTCLRLAENMRKLAIQQGDKRAYAMSYANPLSYYLSKSMKREFYDTLEKLKKSSEEVKLWSFYYFGLSQESVFLLRKREIGEAIQLGENAMKKAYAENNKNGIYVSHSILLNCYLELRLFDKAESEAQEALKAEIGLPDNNFGNTLSKYAEIFYSQRKWQDCLNIIAKYEDIVESNTVRVRLYEYKTICYYELGNMAEYERYSKELTSLYDKFGHSPSGYTYMEALGIKQMLAGNVQEAESIFKKLESPDNFYFLFQLYQKTGDKKSASKMMAHMNEDWSALPPLVYEADIKKYSLELDNNNLLRSNNELALERNQLALKNRNLQLEQSITDMKSKQAHSELERSLLSNKYLEAKNKESKAKERLLESKNKENEAKEQLLEAEMLEKQHRTQSFAVGTILGILILFTLVLFWHIRRTNIKLKKANLKLEKKNRQLEHSLHAVNAANQASDAKSTFLFNMSHDIRTPMNAILGFANLMKKQKDNPEMVEMYTDKIRNSGDYLLSLINNVLDMARIESGNAELDEDFFDLLDPMNDATTLFEELARKKNITLTHFYDIKHRYVRLDKMKVQQIIVNILSNAIKYTPEGGKVNYTVVETSCEREGYASFVSTVADNGIGMTPEFAKTIFDKFSRERNTTESKVIGTGLGMSIVKKLIDLMEGTIEIQTEPGKGSTFIITLSYPIVEHPEEYLEKKSKAFDENKPLNTEIKGKRILLAEDNEINAEIAVAIMEELELKIEVAEDGIQCISMLTSAEPGYYDCILMDIQMPNLNGYDATRRIRTLGDPSKANIPIIAMTANAFEEDRRNAAEAGMNGHIAKPIDVDILVSTLSEIFTTTSPHNADNN